MLKRFAAIDIGSNTIKVKIADIKDQNTIEQVLYKDFPSGLGQNLNEKNIIEPSNLQVCIDGLKEIKNIIKNYKVDKFEFIATHALRKATNQLEIKNIIKLSLGIEINIISGEEEAMLTLYGILIDYPSINNCACINGGGGSTELSIHIPTGDQFFALEIGAVNLYSTCFKNETSINTSLIKTDQLITEEFSKIIPKEIPKVDKIFSVGGSIFNAGYIIKKDKERKISNLTNMKISEKDFESIINLLKYSDNSEKRNIIGMDLNRLDTLLPGILIHYYLMKKLNKDQITISTRSISDGLIRKMLLQETV